MGGMNPMSTSVGKETVSTVLLAGGVPVSPSLSLHVLLTLLRVPPSLSNTPSLYLSLYLSIYLSLSLYLPILFPLTECLMQ